MVVCAGYGNIAAKTTAGQVVTMLYSIIGIPITISVLNDWGTLLFQVAARLWPKKSKAANKNAEVLCVYWCQLCYCI